MKGAAMDIHSVRQQLRTKSIYDIPLRVTYYARVSSESDEQLNSLGNQIGSYEDFIRKNPAWTFVPGYIDEFLHDMDKRRRIHYENYTNQKWGDRSNYDLMLNSGDLGLDKCVELLCEAVK